MNSETILIRNKEIVGTQVDDDLVMMDDAKGQYFGLNPIARIIWEHLETPTTYQALVDFLTQAYNVTPEKCSEDIDSFLTTMLANHLITIAES